MILSSGQSFGAYTIVAPLGRGGMGEVYRARDNRLGRDVALKVLPEEAARDPDRIRRFEQEARAASSLNHPNIVVIYEFGETLLTGREHPLHYLAMELLEGEPLNTLTAEGGIPFRRFLDLACQLTDGLARAHESGIVHRDLKPSNVVVTPDGHVKILDFGLAKLRALSGEPGATGLTREETLTSPGALLGTVGYMAPEQARGEPATAASDQFAAGCIFYELLTGQRAFGRSSAAETLSAILRDEPPPLEQSSPEVPAPARWIIERCLAKSPRDRYASTRDLARDLQTLKEHSAEPSLRSIPASLRAQARRPMLRWAAGAAVLLGFGAAGSLFLVEHLRKTPQPEFHRLTFRHGVVWRALFAPNTNSILFTAAWDGQPTRTYLTLPESAGLDRLLESEPQLPMGYSADGSEVLVLLGASRPAILVSGTLAWLPALGGSPRRILEGAGWADWGKRGRFLAVVRDTGTESVLELRDSEGGSERALFKTPGAISCVRISPDEKQIAFIHHQTRTANAGEVRIVDRDGSRSRALSPRFGECFGLDWNAPSGEIWFTASRSVGGSSILFAVTPSGAIRPLHVFPDRFVLQSVSATSDRCLLVSSEEHARLTAHRAGSAPKDLSWLGWTLVTDLSPDEKSVLFFDAGATQKSSGSWIRSLEGGDAIRLGEGDPGKFSPDGNWVVSLIFPESGAPELLLAPVGAGKSRQLKAPGPPSSPSFAGPTTLLFAASQNGKSEVWRMETDGSGARSLGAAGCDMPASNPARTAFLCIGGEQNDSLFLYPMEKGAGRKLSELPRGGRFRYARWDARGERVFAVTGDRRFLTLAASSGAILSEETLPMPGSVGYGVLLTAAFNADASIQAYSVALYSSGLYLSSGLR